MLLFTTGSAFASAAPSPCRLGAGWSDTSSLLALGYTVRVSAIELEVSAHKSVIASRI